MKRHKANWLALLTAFVLLLGGCTSSSGLASSKEADSAPSTPSVSQETNQTAEPVDEPTDQSIPEEETQPDFSAYLEQMTLEEKVGQLFFARFPEENAAADAATYHLGGYIVFGRDFEGETPDSFRQKIAACQETVETPLLIGVDEEGGDVVRASKYEAFRDTPFPSPQEVLSSGGLAAAATDAAEKSAFLQDLGIQVNLSPVCDLSQNPEDYIYSRTTGQGAEETAAYVASVVGAMKESGMGAVLKHFPGYGANADTHTGFSVDERPLETFQTEDFLPFLAGIASGADAVLVSHNVMACVDDKTPASLSPEVHWLLRNGLNFTGVILTDDLAMAAIAEQYGDNAAILAIAAGNDMVITTDYAHDVPLVVEAVKQGEISMERLDEAVLRVLNWKYDLGLIHP